MSASAPLNSPSPKPVSRTQPAETQEVSLLTGEHCIGVVAPEGRTEVRLLRGGRADPKPRKRYRATKTEWEAIHLSFTAELCWCCGQGWDSLHHILPRGQGGDDVRENLAPVCGNGTMGCHGLLENRDPWARGALCEAMTPENRRYLWNRLGPTWKAWLERNYAVAA